MKVGRHQWKTGISLSEGRSSEDAVAGGGVRATCVVIMCDMRHVATASAATRGSLHAALPREPGDNNGAGMCVPTNSTLAEEAGSPSHGGGGPRGAKQRSGSAAAGGEEGGEVEEGGDG
jgi:hypothetical protein